MEAFEGIIFSSHDPTFRSPQGAIPCGQSLTLRVFVSRALNAYGVTLRYWVNDEKRMIPMARGRFFSHTPYGDFLDEYVVNVSCETIGLAWYQFLVNTPARPLYVCNREDGLGGACEVSFYPVPERSFQITVTDLAFTVPAWAEGAVMVQIFPDRFFRAPGAGDASGKRLHETWDETPEFRPDPVKGYYPADDFFGGNLRGIEEKLDYLQSLHADVLYLNPIFKAYSNHRYDTGDYETVDPLLGTNGDLERLCRKAKERGMRIVLDGVFSHTGSDSRYFNREGTYGTLGAYQSPDSPYASWYSFKQFPNDYDSWWGVWSLPCVRETEPSYRDYMFNEKDGIVRRWLRAGVSGWRLDVADELPDEFIEELRKAAKDEKEDALVLGEVWEDASNKISYDKQRAFLWGRELDSVMNYPLRNAVVDLLTGVSAAEEFCRRVLSLRENYPPATFACLMNFLSTHDLARITTRLCGETDQLSREEQAAFSPDPRVRETARALHKLGALILFALPGMPSIYYGDEAGLEGCRDPFNRGTYPWGHEDAEMLSWYRALGAARDDVLRHGRLFLDEAGSLLSIRREKDGQWRYALINPSDEPVETLLDLSYFRAEPHVLLETGGGLQFSLRENGYYLLLPARGGVLLGGA